MAVAFFNIAFNTLSTNISDTDQLVMQINSAMEEQDIGSQQISEVLHLMNDNSIEVRTASKEMSEGNKAILTEITNLQTATGEIKDTLAEIQQATKKIDETRESLVKVSANMNKSISDVATQLSAFHSSKERNF